MTDKVLPSFGRVARSREFSATLAYGGGSGEGVVWPSSSRLVEDSEGDLASGALGAFNHVSSSGLDVTFDTGEAIVRGAYTARDTQTTITLPESSTTTIYLGWKDSQADTVVIGEASDFGSEDPSLAIWTFTTDGSSVTGVTDERPMADAGYIAAGSIKRGANLIDDGNENLAVEQGQGSGLNADTLRTRTASELAAFHFGDGSDGSISRSSDGNENGLISATDYTLESGVHRDVTSGILVILATNSVTIDGTIDARGYGASGGGGSDGDSGNNGGNGNRGLLYPHGLGGSGGSGTGTGDGGDGGDGDTGSPKVSELLNYPVVYREVQDNPALGPGAGGGGGSGAETTGSSSAQSGVNGDPPGGGGSGADADNTTGPGGDGGGGGGFIYIAAPDITVNGTIRADGINGADGGSGGGGGGGGGSGGSIVLSAANLSIGSATLSVSGGSGGTGGSDGSGNTGGDGAAGANGTVYERVIQ